MILVYKTNIDNKTKAKQVKQKLNKLIAGIKWNFDLEDCDNILRIDSKKDYTNLLKSSLLEFGIMIEELPD